MLVHVGSESLAAEWDEAVACIGTFDGVHLGHQELIRTTVDKARASECPSLIITFDRHPMAILAPERCPPAVADLAANLECMRNLGVAVAVVLPFDEAIAATSAEAFFDGVLLRRAHAVEMVVGHDFAFGHGRQGTPDWLAKRIPTTVVPPFELSGERVSSSRVRHLVASGDVEAASRLLGRSFAMAGVVVSGQKLGRTLGYPTLNLVRSTRLVTPADGIYAGRAVTPRGEFGAAISIGVRPTVGGESRTIEAYLLDYPGDDLYGAAVTLTFAARLREERHFGSLEELKCQMALDVEQTRQLVGAELAKVGL